ncbi:hypothetical protein ACRAWB_15610 [Leifsonia poae]|uniref:hypothetical protein n=1 Tax=Leifsonia poae TaxID=110933 RepID=UPI003D68E337
MAREIVGVIPAGVFVEGFWFGLVEALDEEAAAMAAAEASPATTSTAMPRPASSRAKRHHSTGSPPWRSGDTSTSASTPFRSSASSASRRMRTVGGTVPMEARDHSDAPSSRRQRPTATGCDARPANISSSATMPETVTSEVGSETSGASIRAIRRRIAP